MSGIVEFKECTPAVPLLSQMTLYVTNGAIERLGLRRLELASQDSVLSTTEASLTEFRQAIAVTLPAGETFPNFLGEDEFELTRNLTCHSTTIARGTLKETRLVGVFLQRYEYVDLPNVGDRLSIDASGTFEVVLA